MPTPLPKLHRGWHRLNSHQFSAHLEKEGIKMDLSKITRNLIDCPCGKEHHLALKALEIGSGLLHQTAEI